MRHTASRVADALRAETVGGVLLVAAAVAALIWANSPWQEQYHALRELTIGPAALHLDLSIAHWTAFVKVDKLLILVPIMLNLKGNLEMNLSLRMSTAVRRRRSAVH